MNNIDFLVDTAKHPGFLKKQATTGFFDEYLDNILTHLSNKSRVRNHLGDLSDHSVMALAGLCEYNKVYSGSSTVVPSPTQTPWASSSGDWRLFGTAKRSFDILAGGVAKGEENEPETITVESTGEGQYTFHSPHLLNHQHIPSPVHVNFKSSTSVPMEEGRSRGPDEAVWKLSIEINGRLKSGTVAVYKATNGATVADGMKITCLLTL